MYRAILVGRPNAGKSTLFNALAGRKKSIVSPQAHATRDLIHSLVKTPGGTWALTDMGGMGSSQDPLDRAAMARGWKELARVDLAVVVIDLADFGAEDRSLLDRVRKTGMPVLVAANKIDDPRAEGVIEEIYRAGFSEVITVSATQERGIDVLRNAVTLTFSRFHQEGNAPRDPQFGEDLARPYDATVVLMGRPNAGKSSLMNRLLKSPRALVGEEPGTTRDTVVDFLSRNGKRIRIFDTAGLRRRSALRGQEGTLEGSSVEKTIGSLHGGDAVILLVDGTEDLAEQDKKIAAVAVHHRKNLIIAVNKWDLVSEKRWSEYEDRLRFLFPHVRTVAALPISAKTGLNVDKLIDLAMEELRGRKSHFPTAELNRVLQKALRERPPSAVGPGLLKILYGVQVDGEPPCFRIFVNDRKRLAANYARYIENVLVGAKELGGTPIRVEFRDHDEGKRDTRSGRRGGKKAARKNRKDVERKSEENDASKYEEGEDP